MKMSGEALIPAPREVVWIPLNDPAVVQKCIPGCEPLQQEGEALVASVRIKVGPVSAKFKSSVALTDLHPPTFLHLASRRWRRRGVNETPRRPWPASLHMALHGLWDVLRGIEMFVRRFKNEAFARASTQRSQFRHDTGAARRTSSIPRS